MLLERSSERPPVFERSHPLTDSPVRMRDGSIMSAEKLAQRFYESELGIAMLDQPLRYTGNFGYDREEMQYDLGHDLCPIGHQIELPYHVGKVIEAERTNKTILASLTDEEIGILMLTSMLHDIGETTHPLITEAGLTPVGDIPAGRKRPEDRVNEARIRKFVWHSMFSDVDQTVMDRVEAIIAHQDDTILHEYFEAGHLAQTLETSNFAYFSLAREHWYAGGDIIDVTTEKGSRLSGLLGIARIPLHQQQKDIEKYSHFIHVRDMSIQATQLRMPQHTLLS